MQFCVISAGQVPAPVQLAARMAVFPSLHEAMRQLVLLEAGAHMPPAPQVPFVAHGLLLLTLQASSAVPAETGAQRPVPLPQAWHVPQSATEQQTLSVQWFEPQSLFAEQVSPRAAFATTQLPEPSQSYPVAHSFPFGVHFVWHLPLTQA